MLTHAQYMCNVIHVLLLITAKTLGQIKCLSQNWLITGYLAMDYYAAVKRHKDALYALIWYDGQDKYSVKKAKKDAIRIKGKIK